jgi:hypothetical protein
MKSQTEFPVFGACAREKSRIGRSCASTKNVQVFGTVAMNYWQRIRFAPNSDKNIRPVNSL